MRVRQNLVPPAGPPALAAILSPTCSPQADKDREYYLGHSVKAVTGRCAAAAAARAAGLAPVSHGLPLRAGLQGTRMCWPDWRAAAWWGCGRAALGLRRCPGCTHLLRTDVCTHLALPHRWQKGKDVYWYTRDVEREGADAASELALVKQREADLMAEVRGGWGAAGISCCCGLGWCG